MKLTTMPEAHTVVREGFRKMLDLEDDLEVVDEAQDNRQASSRAACRLLNLSPRWKLSNS